MNIKTQKQFLGNYRGVVKQHGPNGLCKIYIPDVYPKEYSDTPENLPDAEPCQPLIFGGGASGGVFQYPDIGAMVWVFFQSGDINYPVFFGVTNRHNEYFKVDQNILVFGDVSLIIEKNRITIKVPDAVSITVGDNNSNTSIGISNSSSIGINGNVVVSGNLSSQSAASGNVLCGTSVVEFQNGVCVNIG